jgi:hypothetical protein
MAELRRNRRVPESENVRRKSKVFKPAIREKEEEPPRGSAIECNQSNTPRGMFTYICICIYIYIYIWFVLDICCLSLIHLWISLVYLFN